MVNILLRRKIDITSFNNKGDTEHRLPKIDQTICIKYGGHSLA